MEVGAVAKLDSFEGVDSGRRSESGKLEFISFGDELLLKVEEPVHFC